MIDIKINSQSIDLLPNISIQLVFLNPMFNELGNHSLTFEIPSTKLNKKIFQFPHRLTLLTKSTKEFNADIYFNGLLFLSGTIKIRETSKNYSAYFLNNNGDFNSISKLINLEDVDYGDDIEAATTMIAHAKTVSQGFYPEQSHAFPMIYNTEFYGTSNPAYNSVINRFNVSTQQYYLNEITTDLANDNQNTLIPIFYLMWILKKSILHTGFNYDEIGNFFEDIELQKLLLNNLFSIDYIKQTYYIDATGNVQSDTYINDVYYRIEFDIENYDEDSILQHPNSTIDAKIGFCKFEISLKLTPEALDSGTDFSIVYVRIRKYDPILTIYTTIGDIEEQIFYYTTDDHTISFYRNVVNSETDVTNGAYYFIEFKQVTQTSIDRYFSISEKSLIHNNFSASALNIYSNTISPSNHVPDITINDLLKGIQETFGLFYFIDNINRKITFKLFNEINDDNEYINITNITNKNYVKKFEEYNGFTFGFTFSSGEEYKNDIKNITGYNYLGEYDLIINLPNPTKTGDYALVNTLNAFYFTKINDSNEIGWELLSYNFNNYTEGDGGINKISSASTLFQFYQTHPTLGYTTAKTKQKGTSLFFDTGINKAALQFIFYRGFQENSGGDDYPMCSHVNFDYDGNNIGNYELRWDGDYGLIAKFWTKYIYWFENNRIPVENYIKFSIPQLRNIQFWKKYRIDEVNFYIDKIETELTNQGLKISKTTLFKAD